MLLIIEALLLISAALLQDHRAAVDGQIWHVLDFSDLENLDILPLDMAEDSVDDLYVGCKINMGRLVETRFLPSELDNSVEFNEVWQDAQNHSVNPEDNLKWNHSVAIHVYTNYNFTLYKDFNNAVRSRKEEYQHETFTWFSLYFFLTDTIQILKETQNGCKLTYRGTNVEFNTNVLNTEVRFGSFASSSLNRSVTEAFGNKSCFEIYTCEGADISKYSTFPRQKEVLIPPYEKFKVTEVKKREDDESLWCDTVYILESTGVRSDLNCALFKDRRESCITSTFNRRNSFRRRLSKFRLGHALFNLKSHLDKVCNCLRQPRRRLFQTFHEEMH